jgi:hypothetical protein
MVKICEKYRLECDYCDKILDEKKCIHISSNDLGYNETQNESHYCNKDCVGAMIKTWESKYDKEEVK